LLANLEKRINAGDIAFVDVFAKDAEIIAPSAPDVTGYNAIRAMYQGVMEQASMTVHFATEEVSVSGDLAYEHGTYTLRIVDKKTGKVLQDAKNKHIHIFKRQPDGSWKTWRMMVASAEPPSAEKNH
jgi:ketosteroid isomerase-like protein